MNTRIKQLSVLVANQIAAGEVIERPASVVKELLENSLDAGADCIYIDIGFGGLNQIKISDNGNGIFADDLPLAIASHATSKITQLSDLHSISSMGFRGEALASIASISRLSISSKPAEQEHGALLEINHPHFSVVPCARNQGTTIDVRDIFFNAPVRKKFLKSERSEFQAIEMTIKRFAMSLSSIAIYLNHNGRLQWHLPAALCAQTELHRVTKLMGKSFVERAVYLDISHAGMHLRGWLANADYQRSQNDKQWIYLNKRVVKDKVINHAIKQAYEPILYPGRQPACLLFLTINPVDIDVNVHPTKYEVRFQQPRLIHDFLVTEIQQALQIDNSMTSYPQASQEQAGSPWQVREATLNSFLIPDNTDVELGSKLKKLVIDDQLSLINIAKQVYLIDNEALQRHWQGQRLQGYPLPLASRNLLVPIIYPISQNKKEIDLYLPLFAQVGIEMEWQEGKLKICSLPLVVPNLELKLFLKTILDLNSPSFATVLNCLVKCQSFHASFIDEEQQAFEEYLIANIAELAATTDFCKHLSTSICRELLHG